MIGTKLVATALALGIIGGGVVHAAQPLATNSQQPTEAVEKQDSNEQAKLQAAASITQDEATKAVLSQYVGATVQQVELEDENGTVVYGVVINTQDGQSYDVKVDAQTGNVLSAENEADDENGAEADDQNEVENQADDQNGSDNDTEVDDDTEVNDDAQSESAQN